MSASPKMLALVGSLAVGGGVLSYVGTRGGPRAAAPVKSELPAVTTPVDDSLRARGAALDTLRCAGCHAARERLQGPSYTEIVDALRSNDDPHTLAALVVAVRHPRPGTPGFAEVPPQAPLSDEQRFELAAFVLRAGSSR